MSNAKKNRRQAAIDRNKLAAETEQVTNPNLKAYKKWHMSDAQLIAVQSLFAAIVITTFRIIGWIQCSGTFLIFGVWLPATILLITGTINWKRVYAETQYRIWKRHVLREHRKELKQAANREVKTFVDERNGKTKQTTDEDKQKS